MDERIVTLKGKRLHLEGRALDEGDDAPSFTVVDSALEFLDSSLLKGRNRLLASVPSLDTDICSLEIKRFNQEALKLSDELLVVFISMDLPFAQKRFCQANGIERVKVYSDHKEGAFGAAYGVLIKEMRLLSRAIFAVDTTEKIRYAEYVREISEEPDYKKALEAVKSIIGP